VFIFDAASDFWRRTIDAVSYLLGIALFLAIIIGGWGNMIVSWQILEIEGAGAFEVPIYPVRTLIIVFSAICALVYTQLLYQTVTGRIQPGKK
jgi:TRAP-type C4-dicarboxylate transport system permease small subunit